METRGFYRWHSKWPGDGGQHLLSRRVLLASALACVSKAQNTEISNFDLSLLDEWTVPSDLFFVRNHFPVPNVSAAGWKLQVNGAVSMPFEISYEDLLGLPRKSLPVTIECAENQVGGGLVSHAEWGGFSLASILTKAVTGQDARFVRLSGADGFWRSIPIAKATHPDTLIAQTMNGEKLPVSHGFPLRAVIPGWYGMDSVKWLRGIEVLCDADTRSVDRGYVRLTRSLLAGTQSAGQITAMTVKSEFSRPLDGAILVGRRFVIRGAAWAGENRVRHVEVSTDGGKSWQPAQLVAEALPYAWVLWSYGWKIPGAGQYELVVRAEDDRGRRQPAGRPPERVDGYELNAWQTARVIVT